MAGSITERDFVALHGLLDVDHVDDSGPGVPWQLMASLEELFHCDYVTFDRSWTAAQQFVFEQTLSDVREYVEQHRPGVNHPPLPITIATITRPDCRGQE